MFLVVLIVEDVIDLAEKSCCPLFAPIDLNACTDSEFAPFFDVGSPHLQSVFDLFILHFQLLLVHSLVFILIYVDYLESLGSFDFEHLKFVSTSPYGNGLKAFSMRTAEKAFHIVVIIWLKKTEEDDLFFGLENSVVVIEVIGIDPQKEWTQSLDLLSEHQLVHD